MRAVDGQAAFDAMLAWCAADGACSQAHPRLATQWQGLRASLPRDVTVPHPVTGRDETLRLTPDMLGRPGARPPVRAGAGGGAALAISRAAAGRWGALAGLAMAGGGRGQQLATGMHSGGVRRATAGRPARRPVARHRRRRGRPVPAGLRRLAGAVPADSTAWASHGARAAAVGCRRPGHAAAARPARGARP